MGRRVLGIDIGDSHIAGVVLEQQRGSTILHGFHCLARQELENPAEDIRLLCQALGWDGEIALCGLPLSLVSIRNLHLPFSDVKKITQTLPFELEEQLLTPPDLHCFDFSVGQANGNGCLLVVFATLQDWLEELLAGTDGAVDPDRVLPAMLPLAEQCARLRPDDASFLLLHADLHSMSMALVMSGRPMLFRRLSHPEAMILHPPFVVEGDTVKAVMPAAQQCVATIANLILQSLDFFSMENRIKASPQVVVLSGPFAGMDDGLLTFMSQALNMSVERLDLLQVSQVVATEQQQEQWYATQLDRALAVALDGRNKDGFNLRKGPLAKKRGGLSRRRRLIVSVGAGCLCLLVALGYLLFDTYQLRQLNARVDGRMRALYQATFPEVSRIQAPYIEMQAKIKSLKGSEAPLPYFVSERWVLPMLAEISTRIPPALPLKVMRLSLDRSSVIMKGTTDSFNGVELVKTALSNSPHFSNVRIVSATAEKGKQDGVIRFELQMQLENI